MNTEIAKVENPRPWATPPVDVYESDEAFCVKADLPGVTKEDVDIRFEQDTLRIEARRHVADEGPDAAWNFDFRRQFRLHGIDQAKITAELKDGVLALTLPKAEQAKPRQIPITVA